MEIANLNIENMKKDREHLKKARKATIGVFV